MFLRGYHTALADIAPDELSVQLDEIEAEARGFGYEGAAMALDLLDQLTPWKASRIAKFIAGPGESHTYMVIVGIGWSMARLRYRLDRRFSRLDTLLRWLAFDGWGFHEGYFHWPRYVGGQDYPRQIKGYAKRSFDQGLGRSLWFIAGGDPDILLDCVEGFPDSRQGDLWSGIGLACTYTGAADSEAVRCIRRFSGSWWPHVAQGAVFAAKARGRAGNLTEQSEEACRLLTGLSAAEAAALADFLVTRTSDGQVPAFESWRSHIQQYFSV